MWFFLGDKFNGSIFDYIRGQHDVLKVTFKVIWVSKSALAASPAVYSSRIPRANQDKQNPPPRQSTQKPQQKQACGQHQGRHALTRATMHDNARREGSSDRMFEVENADCPPSLSENGVLRSGQKSDLLFCLEVYCPSDFGEADGKLIDGAHMVHVLRPDASIKSFRDYTDKKVIPYIETYLANTKRVDVI